MAPCFLGGDLRALILEQQDVLEALHVARL